MSNRQTTPADEALTSWRKQVDQQIGDLLQRPQGSPNGLMAVGGKVGTWAVLALNAAIWTAGATTPAYCLDADGFVHLRGFATTIAAATPSTPNTIGTLPAGYRPTNVTQIGWASWCGNNGGARNVASGLVLPSGVIQHDYSGGIAGSLYFVDLGGIAPFYAGGQ